MLRLASTFRAVLCLHSRAVQRSRVEKNRGVDAEPDRVSLLKRQLLVTWSLAEVVLNNLTDEECLWCPSTASWTVRPGREGRWEADWVEPEPDEAPPTSLAWVLWHANWWWSMVIDHSFGAGSLTRADVAWAGAADAVASLRGLHDRWVGILDRLSDE